MRIQRYDLSCDVEEAVETLRYWRGRRERLPWHRRAARRECDQMVANWEERLRNAVLRDPSLSITDRVEAGVLVVRTRASLAKRRWKRRAAVGTVAAAGTAGAGLASLVGVL